MKEVERNGEPHPSQSEQEWGYYENVPSSAVQEEVIEAAHVESLKAVRSGTPDEGVNDNNRQEKISRSKRNRKDQDREEFTAARLESAIEKVPLSSSEIQSLIDILLNKQHAGDSEWINVRQHNLVYSIRFQQFSVTVSPFVFRRGKMIASAI